MLLNRCPWFRPAIFSALPIARYRVVLFVLLLLCPIPAVAQDSTATKAIKDAVNVSSRKLDAARQELQSAEKLNADTLARMKKLEQELAVVRQSAKKYSQDIVAKKQLIETKMKEHAVLVSRAAKSVAADELSASADRATARQEKGTKILNRMRARMKQLKQLSAEHALVATQSQKSISEGTKNLAARKENVAKTVAAQKAAELVAKEPREKTAAAKKRVADQQAKVQAALKVSQNATDQAARVSKSLTALQQAVTAAKEAVEASKGTAVEKFAQASAEAQAAAVDRTTELAKSLNSKSTAANAALKTAQAAMVPLNAELKKTMAAAQPKLDTLAKATAAVLAAEKSLADTQHSVQKAKARLAAANEHKAMADSQIRALQPSLDKAQADIETLKLDAARKREAAEEKLKELAA